MSIYRRASRSLDRGGGDGPQIESNRQEKVLLPQCDNTVCISLVRNLFRPQLSAQPAKFMPIQVIHECLRHLWGCSWPRLKTETAKFFKHPGMVAIFHGPSIVALRHSRFRVLPLRRVGTTHVYSSSVTCLPTLLLSLFFTIEPQPTHATNNEITLPAPTHPSVLELRASESYAPALEQLNRTLQTGSRQKIETLVLKASLLSALGRGPEAESVWHQVIDREVWMRTFGQRALIKSLVERGEPAQAALILSKLNRANAGRHLDLALLVADAYRHQDQFTTAASHYRRILQVQRRGGMADQARLGLASSQEGAGAITSAIEILRNAQLQHQTGPAYAEALDAERRLNRQLGRIRAPFAQTEYLALTRRLRSGSRYSEAAALVEEWRAAEPSAQEQLEVELIGISYDGRWNKDAIALCEVFARRYPASPLLPRVKLTEFRLAVRMGDTATARTTGLRLWNGQVAGATATQQFSAGVLLSAYLVAVGDVKGGLELYRELFQRATSADNQRMILWKAGVAALRVGENERALINLRALNQRNPTGDLRPAGLYWQAVAEGRTGQAAAAKRIFRSLIHIQPNGYYGLQARTRLLELGGPDPVPAPPPRQFPTLSLSSATADEPEFKAAMTLTRAGLVTDAAWYLRRLLDRRQQDRGLALLAARASAEAEEYAAVARLLANYFAEFLRLPAKGLPGDFFTLVYPRPFANTVAQAAGLHNLDPAFMFSLMRQESRFDPAARSPVGALGLFQLMPYTATELGPRSGLDHLSPADFANAAIVLQPSVNTAIAATLAADLFAFFGGALAPVIASYNAGEDRVSVWWESALNLREDFFIDTIPYRETRRFVREVIANVAGYHRVHGDTEATR